MNPVSQLIAYLKERKMFFSVLVATIIAHVVVGFLLGLWVIARYFSEPPATFQVKNDLRIPPKQKEHKMDMAKHAAMAPKPSFNEKLVSTRPTNFALPDLPQVPTDQMLPVDPSQLVSDASSLVGAAGLGAGGQGGSGSGGGGTGMSFFGIKDSAQSVVIMIDVSASMFTRTGDVKGSKLMKKGKEQHFQIIRDQAIQLIEGLGINSKFGIIRWSGGARSWRPHLSPATDENKAAAIDHIQNVVDHRSSGPYGGRPGGTRHDYALEELFKLQPEAAYMLSDGNATRSVPGGGLDPIPAKELFDIIDQAKRDLPQVPRIHVIYYITGKDKAEEKSMLNGIARKTSGKFKKVKAEIDRSEQRKNKRKGKK